MKSGRNDMEHIKITGLPFDASRIGLGTWAIGGWLWGGTEESDAIKHDSRRARQRHQSHRHRAGLWLRPFRGTGRQGASGRPERRTRSSPPRSGSTGEAARSCATRRRRGSARSSKIRFAASRPMSSTSIRCIGLTRRFRSRRDGKNARGPSPRGKDPHHRRQQFFAGADGPLQEGGAARRHPAALQSVRA